MQSKLDAWETYTLFPLRIELACQRNTPYLPSFSSGCNITLIYRKRSLSFWVEDICDCWQNSMEVRRLKVFDNVLLLELSVSFWRILSTFSVFQWENHSPYGKKPVLLMVRDICVPWSNKIKGRSCSVLHITFLWEMCLVVKGTLPISHHFKWQIHTL
jgi:hypothetical protein